MTLHFLKVYKHRIRDMESYIIGIGKKIRTIRKEKNLYASEIARRANVSNGLISRIENGRTVPSVPVLLAIISALEVDPAEFFERLNPQSTFKYLIIRSGEYETIEKEDNATGFKYDLIFGKERNISGFEVVLLNLEPNCSRDMVETDAYEFKYMLSGMCDYLIDDEKITLETGDSIIFDGRLPHVPLNPYSEPAKMMVFYLFL